MQSPYFKEEHVLFRQSVREFLQNEVRPHTGEWEQQQQIPRAIWRRMGELGFLGINFPVQYGGSGADFFYSVVFLEELGRLAPGGFAAAVAVQQYIATAHIFHAGSEDLKRRYLVPSIAGEKVGALAITEPDTGSDVAAIRTHAVRDGDFYVVNGAKTYITNGVYGDFATVAVKTAPENANDGISLLVVDTNSPGFTARKLSKLGWHCSDTAEISLQDVRVPVTNLIGKENMGFYYIMESFQLERLVGAIQAVGGCNACLELTLHYLHERQAFGRPLAEFQVLRHRLADLAAEIEAVRQLTYHAAFLHDRGEHAVRECSMAKLLATELGNRVVDACLQCFGGYGYMAEAEISRMYRDARVGTIAGGTSEIMREIIARIVIDGYQYQPVYARENTARQEESPEENEMPDIESMSITEIFESLPARFRADRAGDYQTVLHFDITGEDGGRFTVVIESGTCRVEHGIHGEAKCVVKTNAKTYRDIELGKQNPTTAFMLGKVKVSNVPEMMQFAKLFRGLTET